SDEHENKRRPCQFRRGLAGTEQTRARKIEHGHFKKDDKEDQHVETMKRKYPIKPIRAKKMDRLPSRQNQTHRSQGSHQQTYNRNDRIDLYEPFRMLVDS